MNKTEFNPVTWNKALGKNKLKSTMNLCTKVNSANTYWMIKWLKW